LHFDMGFKKSKSFSKKLLARFASRGPKLPKIDFFHKNGLFTVNIFYNQPVSCPIIYCSKEQLKLSRMVSNLPTGDNFSGFLFNGNECPFAY